jgi:hypothetical protein
MVAPGVFGSSTNSASGGRADPSMLSDLALAKRAVIASRDGMFLYPFTFFSLFVSRFSSLRFSWVKGSETRGASSGIDGVVDFGGVVAVVAVSAGDTERVEGALTAIESFVDAVVDSEVCDPVRRSEAARRGRAARDCAVVEAPLLRLIRAASWFNDGGRTADDDRSGFGACMDACNDDGGLGIVVGCRR